MEKIKCSACDGRGWFDSPLTYKNNKQDCSWCGGTGFVEKEPGEPESKEEPTVSKEEAEMRPTWPDVFSFEETPEKKIRRETATQFACAIIKNSHEKNYQRNTVNDGWWGTHVLDEAIALTDQLLSKLNSK